MIKRTIEISSEPAHLRIRREQLEIVQKSEEGERTAVVPCEDIGLILVDQRESTYTQYALSTLMRHGAVLIVCGDDHLPIGLMSPLTNHTEVIWRIDAQIWMKKPLRKQIWRQIVQAKILAQARNLDEESPAWRRLRQIAENVQSGDPKNCEAQAARFYWEVFLGSGKPFHRDPKGSDPLNVMLNYGYSILRAAVARAVVLAGLLPHLGIHHANRANSFCLADDLMEPLRPLIDRWARQLYRDGQVVLNKDVKAVLLEVLNQTVRIGKQTGPLMVSLHRMTASYVRCLEGEEREILIPAPE